MDGADTKKEAADSPQNCHSRRAIIREFALNTSTHAIPGIARSQTIPNRIFWTVSFLSFTSVMLYFVTQSIISYFEYPTQTVTSIVAERTQTFPAVTFCNYSPLRYDLFIGPLTNYSASKNFTLSNDSRLYTLEEVQLILNFIIDEINMGNDITKYYFSLDSMMISCQYNGFSCNASDFLAFVSINHGYCYTFNARSHNTDPGQILKTTDGGGHGKLELILYANTHLYVDQLTADVTGGMVAMIHDNTQLPLIDIEGIMLIPGRKHKLTYKNRVNNFLAAPYTNCTDKVDAAMQAMFDQYSGTDYAYSQSVCHIICTQTFTYHECGCVNPSQWLARQIRVSNSSELITAPLCQTANKCMRLAAIELTSSSDLWDQFCSQCTQACVITDFTVTPSAVAAPTYMYALLAKSFVESNSIPLPSNWSNNWEKEVYSNYVALEVVSQSLLVETVSQEATMTAFDVLSNVGGHTGLWIGISFLSIMEFIEMLYRLVRYDAQILMNRIHVRTNRVLYQT